MKKILLLAFFMTFAGTAHAQIGGAINNLGSMNSAGSLNGVAGLNAGALSPSVPPSAPVLPSDASVNFNSKNPGEFVPSTFTNFREGVALGKLQAQMKPMTVAEAARLAQEQKKNGSQKPGIMVEQNARGRLVVAAAKP